MLDAPLKAQLKAYLERLIYPVELVATLDDRPASAEMKTLIDEIVSLNSKVSARFDGNDARQIGRAHV